MGACHDHPARVFVVWLGLTLLSSVGVLHLEVDTSTDSILDRSSPAFAFHKRSHQLFGGEEILVAALHSEEAFDPETLARVEKLSAELEKLPDVRRVDSLSTVPLIRSSPDGRLDLDPALGGAPPSTEAERRELEARILADRIAGNSLISTDGRVVAVNLVLDGDTQGRFLELVQATREQLDGRPGWVSGVPVFRTEINTRTQSEILFFVPITAAIIGALLFLFFRSVAAVVIPLLAGALGSWLMLGAMGAVGTPLTLISMILPSVVLALGCAYVMHLLTAAARDREEGGLREALCEVAFPVALSGLTTAIGFVSMAIVRVPGVRDAGAFGALGVLAVLAATLTLVPALLQRFRIPARAAFGSPTLRGPVREALLGLAARAPGRVIGAWAALFAVLMVGLAWLPVETDATQWFRETAPVRVEYDEIRTRLSGISPVNIVIDAPDDRSVIEERALRDIDALTAYLASLPEVGKAVAFTDPLRQLHGGFVGDASQPLPEGEELVEQYLLLLSSVEPLRDLITDDRRAANVLLRVDDNVSGTLRGVARKAEAWWQENGTPGYRAQGTGTMFEFARAEDELVIGQLRGLAIAVGCIAVVLLLVLGSARLALLAMVPNALPTVAIFGFMGLVGIALDAGTVLLGSLALGMAVDDTMHIVSGYHSAKRAGLDGLTALDRTLRQTIPALVYTTLVVSAGFGVLGLSDFTFIRNLGPLTAGIMGVCLAADVILLPALLLLRRDARASVNAPG